MSPRLWQQGDASVQQRLTVELTTCAAWARMVMCRQDRLPVLICCAVKSVNGAFDASCAGSCTFLAGQGSCALTAPLAEEQASCCLWSLSSREGERVFEDASGFASSGDSAADVVSATVRLERSACCNMACT